MCEQPAFPLLIVFQYSSRLTVGRLCPVGWHLFGWKYWDLSVSVSFTKPDFWDLCPPFFLTILAKFKLQNYNMVCGMHWEDTNSYWVFLKTAKIFLDVNMYLCSCSLSHYRVSLKCAHNRGNVWLNFSTYWHFVKNILIPFHSLTACSSIFLFQFYLIKPFT